MVDIELEITIDEQKLEGDLNRVLKQPFRRAFQQTIEFLYGEVFKAAPASKGSTGSTPIRSGLTFDVNFKSDLNAEGFVGYIPGSETEERANYTEYGTGERGRDSFKQFFDEDMPLFTIPILPRTATMLHWISPQGEDVFAKSTKGQPGQAWIRGTVAKNLVNIQKIWDAEFSK